MAHGFVTNVTVCEFGVVDQEAAFSGGEVISISGPSITRTAIDTTHLTSTENYHEFIPGTIDSGEMTFEMNLDADAAIIVEGVAGTLKITWSDQANPNESIWKCTAFCTKYEASAPFDDRVTVSVSFKLYGEIVIT